MNAFNKSHSSRAQPSKVLIWVACYRRSWYPQAILRRLWPAQCKWHDNQVDHEKDEVIETTHLDQQ